MANETYAYRPGENLSQGSVEEFNPPVRNLRKRESRPPAADADRKAQGTRLMTARRKFFKTASMAARALGIAGPTYLAHENGTRQIRGDIAIFYSQHFNINPDWLLLNKGAGPDLSAEEDYPAGSLSEPTPAPKATADLGLCAWRSAGFTLLLRTLKASIGPHNSIMPVDPLANEPGELLPASQTEGWIAELAPPRESYLNECRIAVREDITLALRDFLLIPSLAVESARLFATRLQMGGDLLGGQHVFVDPDEKRVDEEHMYLVARAGGALVPACLTQSARTGDIQIGRSRAQPPISLSDANAQIVGRIAHQFKPLADAEVREIADRVFNPRWESDKLAAR